MRLPALSPLWIVLVVLLCIHGVLQAL